MEEAIRLQEGCLEKLSFDFKLFSTENASTELEMPRSKAIMPCTMFPSPSTWEIELMKSLGRI